MENQPSNNPEPNPNMNPNPKPEGEQDQKSHITVHFESLRCLSSSIRGGDHLRQSLANALDTITNTIANCYTQILSPPCDKTLDLHIFP